MVKFFPRILQQSQKLLSQYFLDSGLYIAQNLTLQSQRITKIRQNHQSQNWKPYIRKVYLNFEGL